MSDDSDDSSNTYRGRSISPDRYRDEQLRPLPLSEVGIVIVRHPPQDMEIVQPTEPPPHLLQCQGIRGVRVLRARILMERAILRAADKQACRPI
jgi:hypothetical protein